MIDPVGDCAPQMGPGVEFGWSAAVETLGELNAAREAVEAADARLKAAVAAASAADFRPTVIADATGLSRATIHRWLARRGSPSTCPPW